MKRLAMALLLTGVWGQAGTVLETETTGQAANNSIDTAQHISASTFTTSRMSTAFATDGLTATVLGFAGETSETYDVDFYSFDLEAGKQIIVDIDQAYFGNSIGVDTELVLWSAAGEMVAYNDDMSSRNIDNGSEHHWDAALGVFVVPYAGRWYISVNPCCNVSEGPSLRELLLPNDGDGGSVVNGGSLDSGADVQPASASRYTLHITVEDAPIPEPATLLTGGTALAGLGLLGLLRRRRS